MLRKIHGMITYSWIFFIMEPHHNFEFLNHIGLREKRIYIY